MEKKESYPQGENPGKKQQQENEKQNPQDKKRKSGSEQDDNYKKNIRSLPVQMAGGLFFLSSRFQMKWFFL